MYMWVDFKTLGFILLWMCHLEKWFEHVSTSSDLVMLFPY